MALHVGKHQATQILTQAIMDTPMKKLIISSLLFTTIGAGAAFAEGMKCDVPTDQWQPREALQTKLESEGWAIRQIKSEQGCYEVYAVNKEGKRMETLFNPKTFESVGEDGDAG